MMIGKKDEKDLYHCRKSSKLCTHFVNYWTHNTQQLRSMNEAGRPLSAVHIFVYCARNSVPNCIMNGPVYFIVSVVTLMPIKSFFSFCSDNFYVSFQFVRPIMLSAL